jgi:hypothetical protein
LIILEQVERWLAGSIQRDDLAIDDGVLWELLKRADQGRNNGANPARCAT